MFSWFGAYFWLKSGQKTQVLAVRGVDDWSECGWTTIAKVANN